jgi:threonine dehydrogenase-like Zn-dependent dehydrogenase
MKALTYHGAKDVRVETVPDPKIVEADDIVLRVTATAICGSDLHLYRGKIPGMEDGDILGHEFMGIVEETGPEVTRVRTGDRVVIPFVIACGHCFFCELGQTACCEASMDVRSSAVNRKGISPPPPLFGYTHLFGGIPGGQAEYVRVPKANAGPFAVPGSLADEQVLFLTDILPTGYQAVENGGVKQGSSIAIFGAGPVGLMCAASARLLGAEKIFMIDHHSYRLDYARETYGVIPIDFDEIDDPAESIIQQTGHRGVDAAIDAVGFEAKGSTTETLLATMKVEAGSGFVLRQCIAAARRGGIVSVPGVYAGWLHAFLFGDAFDKGLTFRMGQTNVHKYLPMLLDHIENGDLEPNAIISHRLSLADAPRGYQIFNDKEEDCRKVVLTP